MRTMLFASAMLLAAAGADGSPGGEPDPNTNDAAAGAPPPDVAADIQAMIDKDLEEAARIRELTPVQEFELRPCPGASHLGAVIRNADSGYRCVSLADWRTDRLVLRAGDEVRIFVLAGEGQKAWDYYSELERRAKEQPPLGAQVQTVSVDPAIGAALAQSMAVPVLTPADPLEETLPADQAAKDADQADAISTGAGLHDTAAESAVAQGS